MQTLLKVYARKPREKWKLLATETEGNLMSQDLDSDTVGASYTEQLPSGSFIKVEVSSTAATGATGHAKNTERLTKHVVDSVSSAMDKLKQSIKP
jgi:hypothetical protein